MKHYVVRFVGPFIFTFLINFVSHFSFDETNTPNLNIPITKKKFDSLIIFFEKKNMDIIHKYETFIDQLKMYLLFTLRIRYIQ